MCVVSMVMDQFTAQPLWPWNYPNVPSPAEQTIPNPAMVGTGFGINWTAGLSSEEISDLRQMIRDFKEAVAAARTIDRLTNQPDCEDPKKAQLEARVAELERQIGQMAACREEEPVLEAPYTEAITAAAPIADQIDHACTEECNVAAGCEPWCGLNLLDHSVTIAVAVRAHKYQPGGGEPTRVYCTPECVVGAATATGS